MSKKLTSNVLVGETWYGPDYPNAGDPPADVVTNPAAYDDGEHHQAFGFREDDFAARGTKGGPGALTGSAKAPTGADEGQHRRTGK